MRINSFTIGADPELFIINKRTGKVVSSIGLIPGEKGNPWVGEDMPKGFGLEIDNILAEFNIPPVKNWEGFVNNIQYMKDYIAKFVANKNPDLGIKCIASQKVDSDQLQSEEAQLFGQYYGRLLGRPSIVNWTKTVNKSQNKKFKYRDNSEDCERLQNIVERRE